MNMPLVLLNRRRRGGAAAFTPAGLFALAEPGVWYDPSDLTTLFQDTAGTTPVTTPGQTVARINDKSGRGNNATQATLASRPTYALMPPSGKRNLLNNTNTLATQTLMMTAAQNTLSFRGTGTVTLSGASTAGPLVGTGASNIVSLTFTPTANNLTLTVSGTVNDAQLELGAARTTYQTVTNDGYNVTEAGVTSLPCLSFNGVNNFLVTPTITPGIDRAQVFAGVRKLSDAAGMIVEASASAGGTAGAFYLLAGEDVSSRYSFLSRGSVGGSGVIGKVTVGYAPDLAVLTASGDIAGDLAGLRRNQTAGTSGTADQGTGNYTAQPLYIGRRAGTSLPFNGQIYSLIVRFGTNLDAGTITSTETWVNGKTGAYA